MKPSIILICVIGFVFLVTSFSGFSVVDTGEVGMKVTFGDVSSKEALGEGLYFYNPITTKLVKYDTRNKVYSLKTDLYTKDNQPAKFGVSITYHLIKSKVIDLHKNTGKDYEAKLFVKNVNGCLKNIVGKIPTDDIVTSREKISTELKTEVTKILSDYGIEVVFVNIDDVDYSDAYESAISAKQIALQKSQEEKNITSRVAEAAKQQVLKAEADAKSKLAIAESEAKAILMKSEAESKGIELKNKALASSPKLVDYEMACRWDGKMPVTVMGGNASPLMLLKEKEAK